MNPLPPVPDALARQCQAWSLLGVTVLAQTTLVLAAGLAALWVVGRVQRRSDAANGPLLRAAVCRAVLLAVAAVLVLAPVTAARRGSESRAPLTLCLPGLPEDVTRFFRRRLPLGLFPPADGTRRLIVFTDAVSEETHVKVFARTAAPPAGPLDAALPYLYTGAVALYAAGVAGNAAALLTGRTRLRRLAAVSEPVSPESPLARTFAALCGAEASPARIVVTPEGVGSDAPFLADSRALLPRPTLFLPAEARQWTDDETRAILAHEAAHLRRRDGAWLLCGRALSVLLWPQPLLAVLLRRLDEAAEEACDAEAVASGACDGVTLARCLLELAERRPASRPSLLLAPAAAAPRFRSSLGRRVAALAEGAGTGRRYPSLSGPAAAALAAASCVAPLVALNAVRAEARAAAPALPGVLRITTAGLPEPTTPGVTFVRVVRSGETHRVSLRREIVIHRSFSR
jgi:hypothetical protein